LKIIWEPSWKKATLLDPYTKIALACKIGAFSRARQQSQIFLSFLFQTQIKLFLELIFQKIKEEKQQTWKIITSGYKSSWCNHCWNRKVEAHDNALVDFCQFFILLYNFISFLFHIITKKKVSHTSRPNKANKHRERERSSYEYIYIFLYILVIVRNKYTRPKNCILCIYIIYT
jgi:hypothetical protein